MFLKFARLMKPFIYTCPTNSRTAFPLINTFNLIFPPSFSSFNYSKRTHFLPSGLCGLCWQSEESGWLWQCLWLLMLPLRNRNTKSRLYNVVLSIFIDYQFLWILLFSWSINMIKLKRKSTKLFWIYNDFMYIYVTMLLGFLFNVKNGYIWYIQSQ